MRKHDLDERAHRTAMSDMIKKLRAQNIDLVFEGAATAQTAGATPAASTAAVAPESLTPSTQSALALREPRQGQTHSTHPQPGYHASSSLVSRHQSQRKRSARLLFRLRANTRAARLSLQ